jgi:hypothetical protein
LQHTSKDNTYKILNNNFVNILDTVSYKYNSLRPAPNQKIIKKNKKEYPITVYNNFIAIEKWNEIIKNVLNTKSIENKKDYLNLYLGSTNRKSVKIDFSKLNNTGLYRIDPTNDITITKKIDFIGHIKFSTIIENGRLGLMVVTIQDNLKSGVEKLIFFENKNCVWQIIKEIELSIW